jgi:hypothetical protein
MELTYIDTYLWPPETRPDFGKGFYVGLTREAQFAAVTEGQQVILRDIDIGIEAVMHRVIAPSGDEWWFGRIVGKEYHQVPEQPLETPAVSQQEH